MSVGWDVVPTSGLGVCVGPLALVPGDVEGLRDFAGQLHRTGAGARRVVGLLAAVDAGRWAGRSGEAFVAAVAAQPAPWEELADVLTAVTGALYTYADAVEDARVVAARAVVVWESGEHASATWRAQQDAWAAAHSGVGTLVLAPLGAPLPVVPAADDPGEAPRRQAQRLYDGALDDVQAAADALVRVLCDGTPEPRSTAERWGALLHGAWTSVRDSGLLGWQLTGGAVLDPEEGREAWAGLAGGLLHAVTHPRETWDDAVAALDGDPDALVGSALPGLLGGALGVTGRVAAGAPRLSEPDVPQTVPEVGDVGPRLDGDVGFLGDPPKGPRQRAEEIVHGHGWSKHRQEMPWLHSPEEMIDYLEGVMSTTPYHHEGVWGRAFYVDPERNVLIVANDRKEGSAWCPVNAVKRFEELVLQDAQRRADGHV